MVLSAVRLGFQRLASGGEAHVVPGVCRSDPAPSLDVPLAASAQSDLCALWQVVSPRSIDCAYLWRWPGLMHHVKHAIAIPRRWVWVVWVHGSRTPVPRWHLYLRPFRPMGWAEWCQWVSEGNAGVFQSYRQAFCQELLRGLVTGGTMYLPGVGPNWEHLVCCPSLKQVWRAREWNYWGFSRQGVWLLWPVTFDWIRACAQPRYAVVGWVQARESSDNWVMLCGGLGPGRRYWVYRGWHGWLWSLSEERAISRVRWKSDGVCEDETKRDLIQIEDITIRFARQTAGSPSLLHAGGSVVRLWEADGVEGARSPTLILDIFQRKEFYGLFDG